MASYWIIVGSPDNFEKTREHGFGVQGMKSRHRKKAERMAPGDKLVWYITGDQAFAGYATITGGYFEDHEPVWSSGKKKDEDYPWRVPIHKEGVLAREGGGPAQGPARKPTYGQKRPGEPWRPAVPGQLHASPQGGLESHLSRNDQAASPAHIGH